MCPYCQPTGDATETTGTSYTINGVLYDGGGFGICLKCGKKVRVEEHECSSRVLCVDKQNNK